MPAFRLCLATIAMLTTGGVAVHAATTTAASPAATTTTGPATGSGTSTGTSMGTSPGTGASATAPAATATPQTTPAKRAGSGASTATVAPGGGPGQVWVNPSSKVYHCQGDRVYGKTKTGSYMTESAAKAAGDRPSGGKACS